MTHDPALLRPDADYRRLAGIVADGGPRRAVVVVHHAADSPVVDGMEKIRALIADGCARPVLAVSVSAECVDGRGLMGEDALAADPLVALSRAGRIDRLDVVSVFSGPLDEAALVRLAAATEELLQDCRLLAPPDTPVNDFRIAFCERGAASDVRFHGGDKRIVVVPEDRRLASAVARPLDADDPESFGSHIAVETLSIGGLWATMDADLLADSRNPADAKPETVRVARSQVRSARLRCPPPAEVIQLSGRLPVPAGKVRTPAPEAMAQRAVGPLVSGRLSLPDTDAPPDAAPSGETFVRGLMRQFCKDVRRFPRRLRHEASDQFQELVEEAADKLRSTAPVLDSLWTEPDGSQPDDPPVRGHSSGPAEVSWPDDWDRLLKQALGVADGATEADLIREEASGSGRQVLASIEHLVGPPGHETLQEVFDSLAPDRAEPDESPDPEQSQGRPGTEAGEQAAATSESTREDTAAEDTAAESPPEKSPPVTAGAMPLRTFRLPEMSPPEKSPPVLLSALTDEFRRQKHEARRGVDALRTRLRELGPRHQERLTGPDDMPAAVPICLAFGAVLAVLAWAVLFAPFRAVLSIGEIVIDADARARLAILATSALALALLLLNLPRRTIRQQRRLILGAALIAGGCSALMVWPGPARSVVTADLSGPGRVLLGVLVLAAMAVCILNVVGRGFAETASMRWSSGLLLLYLAACVVLLLNDDDFRPDLLSDKDARLLFVLSCTAAALLLASYAMLTLVHYRRESKLRQWRSEVGWLVGQHDDALREADVRDAVHTHWLGTACALHRILRLPYGAPAGSLDSRAAGAEGARRGSMPGNPLVKAVLAECEPTGEALERFRRLLEDELVRPGWLHAQYRRAADAYRSDRGGVPEACPYPLRFGEELFETADGDRWPFVQRLYRGDFDPVLRARVHDFVDGDGLDELFADMGSFKVLAGAHPDEDSLALFREIADDPEPPIPPSMLQPAARIADDVPSMKSCLWWPTRLASPTTTVDLRSTRSLRIGGAVVHQAVRVDLSEPIPLSALSGAAKPVHRTDDDPGTD